MLHTTPNNGEGVVLYQNTNEAENGRNTKNSSQQVATNFRSFKSKTLQK
jgi:hypothetical protein